MTGITTQTTDAPSRPLSEAVLLEDFRQQNTNLQNQYARMHNRLQVVTGLNTALLAALGGLAAASGRGDVDVAWLLLLPIAGLVLSGIGYFSGSGDRWLVETYRRQLAAAARRLVPGDTEEASLVFAAWAHAGMDPARIDTIVEPLGEPVSRRWLDRVTSRRWRSLSATRLPAALSLLFVMAWLVVLVLLLVNVVT